MAAVTPSKAFPSLAFMPTNVHVQLVGSERRSEPTPSTWYIFKVTPAKDYASDKEAQQKQLKSPSPSYLENYDEQVSLQARNGPYHVARTFQHFCELHKRFLTIFNNESIPLPNFPKAFSNKSRLHKWHGGRSPTKQQEAIRGFLSVLDTPLGSGTLWQCLWVKEFFGIWPGDNVVTETQSKGAMGVQLRPNQVNRPYYLPSLRYSRSGSLLSAYGFLNSPMSESNSPDMSSISNPAMATSATSMMPMSPPTPHLDLTLPRNILYESAAHEPLPFTSDEERERSQNGLNVFCTKSRSANPDSSPGPRLNSWLFINGHYFNIGNKPAEDSAIERIPALVEELAKPIQDIIFNSDVDSPKLRESGLVTPSDLEAIMKENETHSASKATIVDTGDQTDYDENASTVPFPSPAIAGQTSPIADSLPSIVEKDQLFRAYQERMLQVYGKDAAPSLAGKVQTSKSQKRMTTQILNLFHKNGSDSNASNASSTSASVAVSSSESSSARSSNSDKTQNALQTSEHTDLQAPTFGDKIRRCFTFKQGVGGNTITSRDVTLRPQLEVNTIREPSLISEFEFVDQTRLTSTSTSPEMPKPSFGEFSPSSSVEILPMMTRNLSIRRTDPRQQLNKSMENMNPALLSQNISISKKDKSMSVLPPSRFKPSYTQVSAQPLATNLNLPITPHSSQSTPVSAKDPVSIFSMSLPPGKFPTTAMPAKVENGSPPVQGEVQTFIPYQMDQASPKAKELRYSKSSDILRKKSSIIMKPSNTATAPIAQHQPPVPALPLATKSVTTMPQGTVGLDKHPKLKTSASELGNRSMSNLEIKPIRRLRQAASMQVIKKPLHRNSSKAGHNISFGQAQYLHSLTVRTPTSPPVGDITSSWVVMDSPPTPQESSRSPMLQSPASSSSLNSLSKENTASFQTIRYVHYFISDKSTAPSFVCPTTIHIKLILKPENTIVSLSVPQSVSFMELRRRILVKLMNSGLPVTQLKKRVLGYYTRLATIESIESDQDWAHLLQWVDQVQSSGDKNRPTIRRIAKPSKSLDIPCSESGEDENSAGEDKPKRQSADNGADSALSPVASRNNSISSDANSERSFEEIPCSQDQWATVVKASLLLMPRSQIKALRRPPLLPGSQTSPIVSQGKPTITL
ncbi:hypothetical protein H4219_000987 [Mycoemilia scoparia]|uniref:PX domain-containing protein n=1 Tax=Mycoemilia scoparia TaxID=417184 RepID=A0A9W8A7S9_9FUNG|nr:hypothetical protein H4219_000987 [Mycoemilia scoparia]